MLGQDHQSRLKGNSKGERDLMISDFLAPVTEIFVFALIVVSWILRIISMSLYFPVKGHTGKAQYFISKEVIGIIVYDFLNTQK